MNIGVKRGDIQETADLDPTPLVSLTLKERGKNITREASPPFNSSQTLSGVK